MDTDIEEPNATKASGINRTVALQQDVQSLSDELQLLKASTIEQNHQLKEDIVTLVEEKIAPRAGRDHVIAKARFARFGQLLQEQIQINQDQNKAHMLQVTAEIQITNQKIEDLETSMHDHKFTKTGIITSSAALRDVSNI